MRLTLPRVKPLNRTMLLTVFSCGIEVEKPRYGVQLLFEDEHALVFDDVADLAGGEGGLGPVEVAGAVGAGGHAVAAADAPVVVDDHDAVLLGPGGAGGADLGAGRVLALLAAHGDVEVAVFGNFGGVVVGVGVGEVHALFLFHGEDADPVDLGVARLV